MRKIDNEIVDFMNKILNKKKLIKIQILMILKNGLIESRKLNTFNIKKYSNRDFFNEMININSVKDVIKIVKKKLQPTRPLP